MKNISYKDNHTARINVDMVDNSPDCLGLFRILFATEPRLDGSYILAKRKKSIEFDALLDDELEDEGMDSTLIESAQKELQEIESIFNEAGWVEQRDFHRKESRNGNTDITTIFYGTSFCIGITVASYFNNKVQFNYALGYSSLEDPVLLRIIKTYKNKHTVGEKDHKAQIYVINKEDTGLNLVPFPVRRASSEDKGITFEDLYNDDFHEKSERIIDFLGREPEKRDNNGIIILQGKYGTGKTNYLRHVIRTLNKKIIFLPPDLSMELSNPGFVTFLMGHPNSILIIEDAENVLKTREAGGNQAVANLLNMSDGILGDALSIQIVCTLNAESEHIDKALLREGRLVELHEFNELTEDKTLSLFKKVYGEDAIPPKSEMTLSQIFKCDDFERRKKNESDQSFGFIPPS